MIPIVTGSTKLVTDKVRAIGHLASLIVVGGMLGGMVVYTAYTAKRRVKKAQGSCWYKWGPTVLVGFATCFIIADTVRHVLQDQGVWPEKSCRGFVGCGGSNQYQCADSTSHSCCPPGTYDTIYKGCTYDADAGTKCPTTTGPKVDISWALACDAGKGKNVLDDFLNEKWAGGTAGNETLTNKQELQKLGFNSSIDAYFYHHLQVRAVPSSFSLFASDATLLRAARHSPSRLAWAEHAWHRRWRNLTRVRLGRAGRLPL